MKPFTDRRRAFWLGGVTVLILGFVVAALLLPSTSDPTRGLGPAVHVPAMENVPPANDRMKLEARPEQEGQGEDQGKSEPR